VLNVRVGPRVARPIAREGEVDHAVHAGRAAGAVEILAGVLDGLARARLLRVGLLGYFVEGGAADSWRPASVSRMRLSISRTWT
jgi:hypothetical protein